MHTGTSTGSTSAPNTVAYAPSTTPSPAIHSSSGSAGAAAASTARGEGTVAQGAPGSISARRGLPNKARVPNRILFDSLGHGQVRQVDMRGRRYRQPFLHTPSEREVNRPGKAGRTLSELEILQEKHESEFRQIVPVIADCLGACVDQHADIAKSAGQDPGWAPYETQAVPGIQIEDYVHRLAEYTYISPATLVVALIFLDRICARHSSLLLTNWNVFKLYFVAVRVASKVADLRTLNNKNFSSVGGISNRHLNELEAKFLIDIRFDLYVQPREFMLYAKRVLEQLPPAPQLTNAPVPRPLPGASSPCHAKTASGTPRPGQAPSDAAEAH